MRNIHVRRVVYGLSVTMPAAGFVALASLWPPVILIGVAAGVIYACGAVVLEAMK